MRTAVTCVLAALSLALTGCLEEPCRVDGKTYASGKGGIPDSDGCNTCACEDGRLLCTQVDCSSGPGEDYCKVDGVVFTSGSTSVPAPDGCNTCTCEDGELVACTEKACVGEKPCKVGDTTYDSGETDIILEEDGCNTCSCNDGVLGCTEQDCEGDWCIHDGQIYESGQDIPTDCGACFCDNGEVSCLAIACPTSCLIDGVEYQSGEAVPGDGCNDCSCEDGEVLCTDQACPPDEAACVVGGVEYASGTDGIDDPFSCNKCECSNGGLSCTEINCPEECPPDSKPSKSCARCGPADGCEAVEIGCFIVCDDESACTEPGYSLCVDNACRNVCG